MLWIWSVAPAVRSCRQFRLPFCSRRSATIVEAVMSGKRAESSTAVQRGEQREAHAKLCRVRESNARCEPSTMAYVPSPKTSKDSGRVRAGNKLQREYHASDARKLLRIDCAAKMLCRRAAPGFAAMSCVGQSIEKFKLTKSKFLPNRSSVVGHRCFVVLVAL